MDEAAIMDATQSNTLGKLAEALSKAQGIMESAHKDASNPYFKSKYADLASVWDAIREPLSSNGLAVIQQAESDGVLVTIKTMLVHSSGEWVKSSLSMRPIKSDPQGVGSCITYGRRYGLSAIAGVAPEDDDGNAASKFQPEDEDQRGHMRSIAKEAPKVASKFSIAEERMKIFNALIGKGKPFGSKIKDAKDWVIGKIGADINEANETQILLLTRELSLLALPPPSDRPIESKF